jgi:hypothetical protein
MTETLPTPLCGDPTTPEGKPIDTSTKAESRRETRRRSPPLPRLALRVGVTGHRYDQLAESNIENIQERVHGVLEAISHSVRQLLDDDGSDYAPGPPILRVISSVAEGSDRIVALEALKLGWEIQCPLPFNRDEYKNDFLSAASRAEYQRLLDQATSVLEMDGSRDPPENESLAYAAAGRVVLEQCDILVAIWNGMEARGIGGTAQIVQQALDLGIPVVWIDTHAPYDMRLLVQDDAGPRTELGLNGVAELVSRLYRPPDGSRPSGDLSTATRDLRRAFRAEHQPHRNWWGWLWNVFFTFLADVFPHFGTGDGSSAKPNTKELGVRWPPSRVRIFEDAAADEWRGIWTTAQGLPAAVIEQVEASIQPHYAWADGLAIFHANRYRGAFLAVYGLGFLAACFELSADLVIPPQLSPGWQIGLKMGLRIAAVFSLGFGIAIWGWALHIRHLNDRRIDYRFLAELLRALCFLTLLGRSPRLSRLPAYTAYADPGYSWLTWYLRAVARDAGMIHASLDHAYLRAIGALLRDGVLGKQIHYHRENVRRFERAESWLRWLGIVLFALALLLLLILVMLPRDAYWLDWAALFAAIFPLAGAALAGIRAQSEAERLIKRSRAMERELSRILDKFSDQPSHMHSAALRDFSTSLADLMVREVLDWRVVFLERLIELPS